MIDDLNSSTLSEEKVVPRRKSMLLCGRRRSKSLGGPSAAADFYQSIPIDQSKEDRLKQLLKMSFQHTLLSVCREFRDSPSFDMTNVIDTLSEHYDVTECMLEKDNMFDRALTESSEIEQNEDVVIEKYVEGLKILEWESQEWDNIVKVEEANLANCISSSDALLPQNVDISDDLSELISYDYDSLLENTNNSLTQFTLLADHISSNTDIPFTILNANNKYLKHVKTVAAKYLAKEIQDTPRTLLKNLRVVP